MTYAPEAAWYSTLGRSMVNGPLCPGTRRSAWLMT